MAALGGYEDALRRGWSPDNIRDVCAEQLADIARSPAGFIEQHADRATLDVEGKLIELPDGTRVPRLPGLVRWIWDAHGFIGRIGLRYRPGSDELPSHVLGHIGYGIVPWRRRQGFARRALAHILLDARDVGLRKVMITCDTTNVASRRVIEANGGLLAEAFLDTRYGSHEKLRYFIAL